jgi:hypothetical protein
MLRKIKNALPPVRARDFQPVLAQEDVDLVRESGFEIPMGTSGQNIVDSDAGGLVKILNTAFSDEWIACNQYWIGSKIVRGPNKEVVITELTLHPTEELWHAVLLTMRIIQLGGTQSHQTTGLVHTYQRGLMMHRMTPV